MNNPGDMDTAPIILFVFNRPEHTLETLKSLERNQFSKVSDLFIYADGAKVNSSESEREKMEEVKKIIRRNWNFRSVTIFERDINCGLAKNVIDGITKIVNDYGKIIVLEDDIITSQYFLKFCNEGLDLYANNANVFGISGYCYPTKKRILNETYFLPIGCSWGWATWKNKWASFQ